MILLSAQKHTQKNEVALCNKQVPCQIISGYSKFGFFLPLSFSEFHPLHSKAPHTYLPLLLSKGHTGFYMPFKTGNGCLWAGVLDKNVFQ